MFYLLKNLVISAAKVLGIIDPQPRIIESTLPPHLKFTQSDSISLYSSKYDVEKHKKITDRNFSIYRQIAPQASKMAFNNNSTIGEILRNQYGKDLFKLYPTYTHPYRIKKFKAKSQVPQSNNSAAIISSSAAIPTTWYSNIFSIFFPTSWQNTTNLSPTLAIQDSPAIPVGFRAFFNYLTSSFFIGNQSPRASTLTATPTLPIQKEQVLPVENVQTETTVPAINKVIISYSKADIYDLLRAPEVLQQMLRTGELKITPLNTEPPKGALKAFILSLSGYETTGLLSEDINGALSFKVGEVVIPMQFIQQALIPTESNEDGDEDLIEVPRGENIDEENSRSSRRTMHDDTTLEEEITEITSRRLILEDEDLSPYNTKLAKLTDSSKQLMSPIKESLASLLEHINILRQAGEDPTRLTEILELTDALITSEPGEDRSEKLAEYQLAAKSMHSNSYFKWQALGAAMLILGASILALGVGIIFTTPATVAGALLTAGGTGLMLASAGIFASNRKNISSSMTKLAEAVENQDDEFEDDEDEDGLFSSFERSI